MEEKKGIQEKSNRKKQDEEKNEIAHKNNKAVKENEIEKMVFKRRQLRRREKRITWVIHSYSSLSTKLIIVRMHSPSLYVFGRSKTACLFGNVLIRKNACRSRLLSSTVTTHRHRICEKNSNFTFSGHPHLFILPKCANHTF